MQPRDERILEHILDYCDDIAQDLSSIESSRDAFMANTTIQRSIAFCILQIGELVGKLSEELRAETTTEINWASIKAMRNIVVHDYGNVELDEVWDAAMDDTPVLNAFCEEHLAED